MCGGPAVVTSDGGQPVECGHPRGAHRARDIPYPGVDHVLQNTAQVTQQKIETKVAEIEI